MEEKIFSILQGNIYIYAASERCFSTVYNEKRNSLDPYNVEKIIIKRIWIFLIK
jgi:hypothetical protein